VISPMPTTSQFTRIDSEYPWHTAPLIYKTKAEERQLFRPSILTLNCCHLLLVLLFVCMGMVVYLSVASLVLTGLQIRAL
jgi:hypothetical protein